jgi:integrase
MTDTPKQKYERTHETLWEGRQKNNRFDGPPKVGNTVTREDADRIQHLCDAFDSEKLDRAEHTEKKKNPPRKRRGDRSYTTLRAWMYRLVRISEDISEVTPADGLCDAPADDINELMEVGYYEGNVESTDGMTKGSVNSYQNAARMFFRYHADLGVDPEQIARYRKDEPSVDPDDMLTREEIDELTQACEHPRDKMIFHLLLYTGLRSTAARQLQLKHINLEDGTYRLPEEHDGLKNAAKRNGKRPLLLAEGSIRQWLSYHPAPDDDDAYLITAKPNSNGNGYMDPYQPVGHGVLQYTLKNIKARSGVEKPVYPHMLRHNFVTVCKRDYELPNDTVKYLIGHAKDSRVMETTYSHLSGGEHTEKAMIASGVKEPEDEDDSALTPVKCTCGATNPPGARACANCGIVFTPDARNAQETLDESVKEAYRQTDPDDSETVEEIEAVEEALDDPETVDKLLDNEQVMDKLADKVAERMGGE